MTAWPTHPTGHNKTIAEMTASEREAMCNASKARAAYRGWSISPPCWPKPWTATGPDYDASYEGPEDGWVSSGGSVDAPTREALLAEIDAAIEDANERPNLSTVLRDLEGDAGLANEGKRA